MKNTLTTPYGLVVLVLTVAMIVSVPRQSSAQSSEDSDGVLEEVIVTASKVGDSNLQDTPIAITAFSEDALDRSVMKDFRDISHLTPGLIISENANYAQVYIRGIGTNNVFPGADPSSTIHLDGVYLARPQAVFNSFLDVERIEVLRGPQGTLYGRNSVGGTINVISKTPSLTESHYKAQGMFGNYDFWQVDGYASAPLIEDQLAGSVAVQHTQRDAYRENISTGNDIDDDDSTTLKGQLRWVLSPSVEVTLRADYFEQDSAVYGYMTFAEPPMAAPLSMQIFGDADRVALNLPNSYGRENWGLSAKVSANLNANWDFTSLTAYRVNDWFLVADTDASELNLLRTQLGEDQDQFSQEFNFAGQFSRLQVLLGAYYFTEQVDSRDDNGIFVLTPGIVRRVRPFVDTTSWAVFGQLTYAVSERWFLTAGGRYTDEDKDFLKTDGIFVIGNGAQIADLSFPEETGNYSRFTPKFGVEFRPHDDFMVYGSISQGYKSGGFNFTAVQPGGYDEEVLWAYEAGMKSELLEGRARLNLAAFHYDYEDLQVQSFVLPGQADVSNAATANVDGLELELLARVGTRLDLGFNLAYLDAKYDKYPEAPLTGGVTTDASGNSLSSAPEWSGSAVLQYQVDVSERGGIKLRAEYNWQSEILFTADNNPVDRQGDYGLANASVGYLSNEGWEIALWGRNLTDEAYATGTAPFALVRAGRFGPPRTYGVRATWQF